MTHDRNPQFINVRMSSTVRIRTFQEESKVPRALPGLRDNITNKEGTALTLGLSRKDQGPADRSPETVVGTTDLGGNGKPWAYNLALTRPTMNLGHARASCGPHLVSPSQYRW